MVIIIILCIYTCKKSPTTAQGDIDYSSYRISQYINHIVTTNSDYYDTTKYSYNGENVITTTRYSNSAEVYRSEYIKDGNTYNYTRFDDDDESLNGFYSINNLGYIDSSSIVRMDGSTNNTAKWKYNTNGQQIQSTTYYGGYTNDVTRYYLNDNYDYWIYNFDRYVNPISTQKDSIVFEYYNSKPMYVLYGWALEKYSGKPNNHLVKKRTYYDLLNNNSVRQIFEYDYILDDNGLVVQRIWRIIKQPSGEVSRTDNTTYTYERVTM